MEAYKRRQDRRGMALALAGAIEALLGVIEARDMTGELARAVPELDAGRSVEFTAAFSENAPFQAITLAYCSRIGDLGGDLAFRVARFLTYNHALLLDLQRLEDASGRPNRQAALIRQMGSLWRQTQALGAELVADLRRSAGSRPRARRPAPARR